MENYPSSMSYTKSKNKLKLFGADIGFSQAREPENEYYAVEDDGASLNSSSSTMSGSSPSPSPSPPEKKKKKKYECKWCFKVLANSQALGGHQNAHKKERMMRKIQLQASRAAGFGYYVDQSLSAQDYCYSYGSNEAWAPDHRQISFGSGGDHDDGYFCGSDVTFQGEDRGHGFSLTHGAADNASNYHGHLDLQLGLGL